MNKRSRAWENKQKELDLKEELLRGELDEVSDDVQQQVKSVIKISLVTGGVFLATYGLYKMFFSSKPEPKPEAPKKEKVEVPVESVKVKSSPGFSFKNLLMERLTLILIKFLGAQLSIMLNKKLGLDEENEDPEEESGN